MKYHISAEMFYILGQPTDFPTRLASILYDKRFSTAVFSKHLSVDPFPPLQQSHSPQQLCPSSRKGAQLMLTLGPWCTQARGLCGCSNFHPVHVIKPPTQTKSLQDWDQLYPPVANPASKIQLPESTKKFPSQLLRGAWSKPLSYTQSRKLPSIPETPRYIHLLYLENFVWARRHVCKGFCFLAQHFYSMQLSQSSRSNSET